MLGAVRAGSRCGIPRAGVRAICTQAANNSRSSLTSLAAARQEKSVASAAVGGIYHHSQNRHRGFASSTRRLASSSSGETAGTARDVMSGQWSISSPKQLYEHLSQYIIGQERAKRVLSVAVFNHYLRITPTPPPDYPAPGATASSPATASAPVFSSPSTSTSTPSNTRHHLQTHPSTTNTHTSIFDIDPPPFPANLTPSPRSSTSPTTRARSRSTSAQNLDPSRPGADLEDGTRGDSTRAVGANGEGADPTLTHDLLDMRSREGLWSRDGFFSSSRPSRSDKETRRKGATAAGEEEPKPARPVERDPGVAKQKVELEEGFLASSADTARTSRGREDVLVEKSNVLMIGPTGTGKTLMAKTLAKVLDVPFASCDATTYTQAGYVGDDVENCVLRLLQNADYDVSRAEVGIIHIDEIDKLARRGGGEYGSWGGGRDVGGEGVQQALLRLLEGTTLSLQAKPPANWSPGNPSQSASSVLGLGMSGSKDKDKDKEPPASPSPSSATKAQAQAEAAGGPLEWDPNNPMNRGFNAGKRGVREGLPGFSGGGGGGSGGKTETFVIDTSNILFVLSGAFVGLESIVQRRLGKGSIGFGAPLPSPSISSSAPPDAASKNPIPLKGLNTADLTAYGLIPEFLGRLPVLSTLHPLSVDDLVRVLSEPKNALVKQYQAQFDKIGAELQFTSPAIKEIARVGLERGGGARGLKSILEEVLLDAMYDAPGSSIRYILVSEAVVKGDEPALYFSRGQRVQFMDAHRAENQRGAKMAGKGGAAGRIMTEEQEGEEYEVPERARATG